MKPTSKYFDSIRIKKGTSATAGGAAGGKLMVGSVVRQNGGQRRSGR